MDRTVVGPVAVAVLGGATAAAVIRWLAAGRAAARHRHQVLARAGARMAAAVTFDTLSEASWQAQSQLLAGDPVTAFLLVGDGDGFVVAGGTPGVPTGRRTAGRVLDDALAAGDGSPVTLRGRPAALTALAPRARHWVLVAAAGEGGPPRLLVLAGAGPLAPDLVSSSRTLMMQAVMTYGAMERRADLQRQALHDGLTDLPNRRMLLERLARARHAPTGAPELALMYLDLDGFKAVNDRYGHAAGDHVLVTVAARLTHAVRAGDLVARLGGDEFAVLIHHAGQPTVVDALMTRLDRAVRAPILLPGGPHVTVGASIGVQHGDHHTDPDLLLRAADTAMYRVKAARHRPPAGTDRAAAEL